VVGTQLSNYIDAKLNFKKHYAFVSKQGFEKADSVPVEQTESALTFVTRMLLVLVILFLKHFACKQLKNKPVCCNLFPFIIRP